MRNIFEKQNTEVHEQIFNFVVRPLNSRDKGYCFGCNNQCNGDCGGNCQGNCGGNR